jgi:hypothetical protein
VTKTATGSVAGATDPADGLSPLAASGTDAVGNSGGLVCDGAVTGDISDGFV